VAFLKDVGRAGVGVTVGDHIGQVLAARSSTKKGVLEPKIGETVASYHATQLCNFMGLQKVILEGDAKLVVDAINAKDNNWSSIRHLVEDTCSILQSNSQWKCVHLNRSANMPAYRLAKLATIDVIDKLWNSLIPNCIRNVILIEQIAPSSD
jgi:ribonuclease HI